jgi:hypothetical protein
LLGEKLGTDGYFGRSRFATGASEVKEVKEAKGVKE